VAPVVVKPDMVSKKAFVKLGMAPESRKGRQPNSEKKTQPRVTMAKASRAWTSLSNRVSLKKSNPETSVMPAAIRKKT